ERELGQRGQAQHGRRAHDHARLAGVERAQVVAPVGVEAETGEPWCGALELREYPLRAGALERPQLQVAALRARLRQRLVVAALVAPQPTLVPVEAQREVAVRARRLPAAVLAAVGTGETAARRQHDRLPLALHDLPERQQEVGVERPPRAAR